VRSWKNPKSRFQAAGSIPSENEGKVEGFAACGTAVKKY
jgi:hypothetical protein